MLRSLFSAVSGLRSHQTMMDVVGNNISNVNTAGYKATRVTFQEALTQVVRGATAAGAAQGGVNPFQLGLGANTAGIDGVFTQGATQVTGRATDLAIAGDGFFIVERDGEQFLTRAGVFGFDAPDAAGLSTLVGPGGERVLGWDAAGVAAGADPAALAPVALDLNAYSDITIGTDGTITGRDNATGDLVDLGAVATATVPNPGGLTRVGESLYTVSANSGDLAIGLPGTDGRGALQAGTLEMSNVDLAQEFTNLIMAQRGFQANSRTITASDELLQDLVNLRR